MESYYSILYYRTNSLTDEYLALAVFAGGGEGPFMYLCDKRLKLLRELLHSSTFLATKRYLVAFQQKVDEYRAEAADLLLFDPVFAKEELSRLKDQLKGNFEYSEPTVLNEWLTADFFQDLTKQFLGTSSAKNQPKKKPVFHLKWRAQRFSNVYADWRKDVDLSDFAPTANFNFKFDLVHPTNKKLLKGVDFDWSEQVLNRRIQELSVASSLVKKQIVLVFPAPRTRQGKARLASIQMSHPSWNFVLMSELS